MIKSITNFLNDYQELWQTIADMELPLPTMDVTMHIIDDKDYCECDFSDKQSVYIMFFRGTI